MNNSPEKFFQLSGKIFPESWKNFSGELQLKLKLIFFLQVEKSQEKNLNNSLGNRKVQNNPENVHTQLSSSVFDGLAKPLFR